MAICSYHGCNREVYEGDRCIFHCEKRDWYVEDEKGKRDWGKSYEKCRKFEKLFNDELAKNESTDEVESHFFSGYSFPSTAHMNLFFYRKEDFKSLIQEFEKPFKFESCTFCGNFHPFETPIFKKGAEFFLCSFEGRLEFIQYFFDLNNSFLLKSVLFDSCTFEESIYIEKNYSLLNEGLALNNINLEKAKMDEISFSNPNFGEKAKVFIENVSVKTLKFCYFSNLAQVFLITDVDVTEKLSFFHSNLVGVDFNNFDVSRAKKINLEKSSFIGSSGNAIFNGVNWGDNLSYRLEGETRDILRQLKHVNDLQGNIIDANIFYSLEMSKVFLEGNLTFSKTLLFLLNKMISNFSEIWYLPVIWYFAIAVFIYKYAVFKIFFKTASAKFFVLGYLAFFSFTSVIWIKIKFIKQFDVGYKMGLALFFHLSTLYLTLMGYVFYNFPKNSLLVCKISLLIVFVSIFCFYIKGYQGFQNLSADKKFEKGVYSFFVVPFFGFLCFFSIILVASFIEKDLNFISFLDPFNTKFVGTELGEKISFVLFKLISIFLGYQLITALRHYTRRK